MTIAVAESCTGGLLASRLTDVPGSSDYVERGVVCYSNRAKVEMLGVPRGADRGARRGQRAGGGGDGGGHPIARAARTSASASPALRVQAAAAPQKPVGTVAIAAIVDADRRVRTFQFIGGRDMVKFQAAQSAMNMLRLMLLNADAGREWSERAGEPATNT